MTDEDAINITKSALGMQKCGTAAISRLQKGGSDRTYYRVRLDEQSVIFVHYNPDRQENNYYAAIADFLSVIGVRVPAVIHLDQDKFVIIMEDLGDEDLWSFRHASREVRFNLYCRTLKMIHKLHVFSLEDFPHRSVPLMNSFDADLYRWERDYFRENFLEEVCGMDTTSIMFPELEKELSGLADRIMEIGMQLIHRDLQSQNVMIKNGEPALIDFQGMRQGSMFYDLGSFLYDPYVSLTDDERLELLHFYYDLDHREFDWDAFETYFHEASAQRLMQALGAFGFLGVKKGKKDFLGHIPGGIRNLISATANTKTLPLLNETAQTALSCLRLVP